MSVVPRMNRLFAADRKCVALAIDHAQFNEVHLLDGVEDIDALLARVARSKVDAILLSLGNAMRLQKLQLDQKPALILRCDVTNVYSSPCPSYGFSQMIENPVEQALALDAAAVLLNFFLISDDPLVYHHCIENVCKIKVDCERFGMPLILEPLILERDAEGGAYGICGDLDRVRALTRQVVELGAHIVKSDPTDSPESYQKVVEVAGGVPLLPRGGGKVGSEDILERTHQLISGGASGVVYGRNIFQDPNIDGMINAIHSLVHGGESVEGARDFLAG
ncbi:MAG: aldolase [Acidobacteriota bacterium]|nr:MAG: aldolase [Acidobacteriota bacterium]